MMEKDSVLWQNEISANKVLTYTTFVTTSILVIVWILVETGIFYLPTGAPRGLIIANLILLFACGCISRKNSYDKKWIKYMLMGVMLIVYGSLDSYFTYAATLLMIIPMVLSSKYFSPRYTRFVVFASFVVFFISAIWGANHGVKDINSFYFAPGTVLEFKDSTTLSAVMPRLEYDHRLMIINTLRYSYLIKFILSSIIAAASYKTAKQGRDLVLEQQKLTESAVTVGAELSLATKIQKDMLPSLFPAFPDRSEFDLYASMTPAKEVGGDFYDFFLVDDDHLGLVIADVSEKGIPAAMFMMFTKNIIANNVLLRKSPAKAMEDANAAICGNNREYMFLSVWLGVLEISTGILRCVNAGHNYPVLKRGDSGFELFKDEHGLVMGLEDAIEYDEYELALSAGDRLFVYTDGVSEAANADKEAFGEERMVEVLNRNPEASPKEMLDAVHSAVIEFAGEDSQLDDITMLALEYRG